MKPIQHGTLLHTLLTGDTRLLRFFFALCSYGYALFALATPNEFLRQNPGIESLAAPSHLGVLFLVYASSTMYGVLSKRYSLILLFTEGLLGVFLWCGVGFVAAYGQGSVGPTAMGGFVAWFLLVRYPTHYTWSRDANA